MERWNTNLLLNIFDKLRMSLLQTAIQHNGVVDWCLAAFAGQTGSTSQKGWR